MGSQDSCLPNSHLSSTARRASLRAMAPTPMKTMKTAMKAAGKPMSKGAIAEALATSCELKKSVCSKVIDSLAEIATTEVGKTGLFSIPGLCRLKTRTKPATKAGEREVFGKVVMVKAKPARKIVKAFPAAALKKSI